MPATNNTATDFALSAVALSECAAHIAARIAELDEQIDALCINCDCYEQSGRAFADIEAAIELKATQLRDLRIAAATM
jgi:hypothetical protein